MRQRAQLTNYIVSAQTQWLQDFWTCDNIAHYCYLSTNIELQMTFLTFLFSVYLSQLDG